MKTKIFIFVFMVFCLICFRQSTSSAQSVWSTQILSPPNGGVGYYNQIYFVNSLTGWAAGYSSNAPNSNYGVLLKTTSGGDVWAWVYPGFSTNFTLEFFFLNENIGWAWTIEGALKKTTNGGVSWLDQTFGGDVYTLYFLNENTGYATGAATSGFLRKTTNGGTNWTTISSGPVAWDKIKFINEQTGWVSAASNYFARTTDGGLTWTQTLYERNTDFFFINAQTGWVTIPGVNTTPATIKKTLDGGQTWTSILFPSTTNTTPYAIKFIDQNMGWCSAKGMYITTNGGLNWNLQFTLPGTGALYDFCFIGRDSGWASSQNRLLRTVNGNAISVTQTSSTVPNEFSLKQNYPNPFNPETKINFEIKNSTFASLKVFDMTGKEIKILVNEDIASGSYEINFNGSELNSGVYFYTLKTDEFTETKKMMLVK